MDLAIIWGLGHDYNQYINCIKLQEELGELRIIGVTDSEELYSCLDGYTFISADKLESGGGKTHMLLLHHGNILTRLEKKRWNWGSLRIISFPPEFLLYPVFVFQYI